MSEELQRTDSWLKERAGKATASKIADIVARTKTGYSASRANYMSQLVVERLTGEPIETYVNSFMQHGIDTEPQARAAYELFTGNDVMEVGFIPHPIIHNSGASPDGTIGENGLVEIKCPQLTNHLEFLLTQQIDKKYLYQIYWQMACTKREWCDYVSFNPKFPMNMQLSILRVERDNHLIAELESEVTVFLDEVNEKVQCLKQLT